ncbi:putative rho guanine nucleotide exchange factor gef2 [Erysiphe necator]|uniref:Putative rho guanine nucleotide exchange factor gef2 n=1 Tax=Uncinula necator TaxID=52586 RepID=A0A0B1PC60_UNCNE|nr:putative rho guanine nucleotide exchange factor gef2 [Erysiphe necator]
MVRITDELILSHDEVTLYHTTDSYLGHLPVLIFHGPSIISNSTLNSSRIQAHIFSVAGFQSYQRITVSPNLPFHQSVNYLPREKQGDETCRGIAFCLMKYFKELPDPIKNSLVVQFASPRGKQSLSVSSLFSEQHAAILASAMIKVENTAEVWNDVLTALRPQNIHHLDLDLILPCGSIQKVPAPEELDDNNAESELEQYGKYASLVRSFGDVTFLPSSRLRRAPSRANSTNRSRSFSIDQKTSLRREMGELVDTEERYVIKMYELVQHVANDFREKAKNRAHSSYSPSIEDLERLFPPSLDKILQINTAFLEAVQNIMDETEEHAMLDLEAPVVNSASSRNEFNWRDKDPTGAVAFSKILLEWFPQFSDCYQEYIRASQLFPQIITSFVKQQSSFSKRVQMVGEQHLRSAVIEPVQRLPRYSLFIDNIVSCLPSLHPAIKPFLKARDIITSICSMDSSGPENVQIVHRLENLVEAWPKNLVHQNRLVTAVDYVELVSPFRQTPASDSQKGIFLIFTDRIVLLNKLPRSNITARGFLAEIDKPSAASMMASMTATASGNKRTYDLCFSNFYMLNEVRFTVSDDSRNVSLISACLAGLDIRMSDKNSSSIRIFYLHGAYEGKGSKFTEEITKAKIEGRFPESERESSKWSFRSMKSTATDLTLHTAVFEERTDMTSSDRKDPAPIRILVDHTTNSKAITSSHVGVEIIANITQKKPEVEYRLKITGLRDKVFIDDVVTEQLLPQFFTRIAELLRYQYSPRNMSLTASYISLYRKILKSIHIQSERDKQRSFMPSSPVKLLTNLFNTAPSISGSRNSRISNKINFSSLTRSESNKSKVSLDEIEFRAEALHHSEKQLDNHLIKLEEIFTAYTIAIHSRKGNVVGRALRSYGNVDELTVNAVYNTFIENPYDQRIASEVTIDILFLAFKKYLRIAWMEQMGDVVSQQTLDELQLQALRLISGDFAHYVRLILSEMTPQNRRAFISIVKLLSDMLDGCSSDGDQGEITAAFAELLVIDGNPHDYINLLDRLVMDQENIFQTIGKGAKNGTETGNIFTSISGNKSNASAVNSIASSSSSFRKRFAETLLRQNSSPDKQSVWRSLNKNNRATVPGNQLNSDINSKMPLRRSRSIESPNRRSTLKDRPTVLGAFEERPSSSSGPTVRPNMSEIMPSNEITQLKSTKKKRRSSLSDLKSLNCSGALSHSAHSITPTEDINVGQDSLNSISQIQSPSKIPLAEVSSDPAHPNFYRTGSPTQKENLNLSTSVRYRKNSHFENLQMKTSKAPPLKPDVILIKDLWTTPSLKEKISLTSTNIPTPNNRAKTILKNASRPLTSHSNLPRSPQKLRLQSPNKSRLSSPQKLRDRVQNESLVIQNAEIDICSELSKIGAQMAQLHGSDKLICSSQQISEPNSLSSLQLSLSSLTTRISRIIADLKARNQLVESDLEKSLSAFEFKIKGLDQLYREAAAENELLYERFNGELAKIAKAVKGRVEGAALNTEASTGFKNEKAEKGDLVNKIIETTNEIAKVRSENTKLKREVLSLKTLLKVCE